MARLLALVAMAALLAGGCAPMPPPNPSAARAAGDLERERTRLTQLAIERREKQIERVERVGRRLLEKIPDPPRVQFVLIPEERSINAGATFGQVAVTGGLLDFVRSDDELAAVLGHELAHITEGHVTKGMIGGIALTALAILVESQAPGLGNTAGSVGQLFMNRFTQGQEREADRVGIEYAYVSGYDPLAAASVQERLAVEAPETMVSNFFGTHPSSVERMITAREQAGELLAKGPPPGRAEVLALERAGEDRFEGATEPEEPAAVSRTSFREAESPGCARARVYLEMARDAGSPEERRRLERRAAASCP